MNKTTLHISNSDWTRAWLINTSKPADISNNYNIPMACYRIILLVFLLILMVTKSLYSFEFVISGHVSYRNSLEPVSNHKVIFTDTSYQPVDFVYSDSTGSFKALFTLPADSSDLTFYIMSANNCNDTLPAFIDSVIAFDGAYNCDIEVCENSNSGCQANFQYFEIAEATIQFIDSSQDSVINWLWDFGDGDTSNYFNPIHVYQKSGVYNVVLTILTVDSCLSTSGQFISIAKINKIYGSIYIGQNLLPKGRIYAYVSDTNGNNYEPVLNTSFPIDSGYFEIPYFYKVPHILYAVPELNIQEYHIPEYFPTYSGNTKYWQEAETFLPDSSVYFEINLLKQDSIFYGHGEISGVLNTSNKPITNVEDICILLLDTDFQPIKYTYVNFDNSFEFNKLPYGDYYLLVDMIGVPSAPLFLSISNNSPLKKVFLRIDENGITSAPTNRIDIRGEAFPNPFNNKLNIPVYNTEGDNVIIKVYNALGKLVFATIVNDIDVTTVDLDHLKKGLYVIKVKESFFKVVKM